MAVYERKEGERTRRVPGPPMVNRIAPSGELNIPGAKTKRYDDAAFIVLQESRSCERGLFHC